MKKHEVTFQITLCVETDVPASRVEEAFKLMLSEKFAIHIKGTPKVFTHRWSEPNEPCVNPV